MTFSPRTMSPSRTVLLTGFALAACTRAAIQPPRSPAPNLATVEVPASIVLQQDTTAVSVAHAPLTRFADATVIRSMAEEIARVFGDSVARVDSIMTSAVVDIEALGAEAGPMLSIDPYATHERVEYFVKLFSGTARERIGERMSRGTRYDPMIRAKLRAGGIPEEFTYLALVESGYDPDAYSRAAAVGMWQFMTGTARDVGLRVDWWIDERRDPVHSTDAAIRLLNDLRGQFGSLYLAAAAYNGGAGRVSRSLARISGTLGSDEPDDHFFALADTKLLRPETRDYVPQLIAAALIGRNPAAYGIVIDTQPALEFDSVAVPAATALAAVARACSVDGREIAALNGHILRGMTPPTGGAAWVRVPGGCAESFDSSFRALPEATRLGTTKYVVKASDTPAGVAKKNGVTLTMLRQYNRSLTAPAAATLKVGSVLQIPTKETRSLARDVPDPSIERYGTAGPGGTYVVRKGDTLGGIAQRNNTTVAALKRINGLKSDVIRAGQTLRIR
jgi:membrane-bound lytic murein transglycosylase D